MPLEIRLDEYTDMLELAALSVLEGYHRTDIHHPAVAIYARRVLEEPGFTASTLADTFMPADQIAGIEAEGYLCGKSGLSAAWDETLFGLLERKKAHPESEDRLSRRIDYAVMRLAAFVTTYRLTRDERAPAFDDEGRHQYRQAEARKALALAIGEFTWQTRQDYIVEIDDL